MLHNDISNRSAPAIYFRVDNFLLKETDNSLVGKLITKLFNFNAGTELDRKVAATIQHVYKRTDMTVHLIYKGKINTLKFKVYKRMLKMLMSEVFFSELTFVNTETYYEDINMMLNTGEIYHYVDNLTEVIKVMHKGCRTLDEINLLIGRTK